MVMKNLRQYITMVFLALMAPALMAQEVSPVDFMRYNPYQMKTNPATDLPYESVMSMVIGNIGVDVQNTNFRYDNLFDFDAQGRPTVVNLRKFADGLDDSNFLGVNANVDLFTLYRRFKKGMFTFDYDFRVQGDAKYNDGLFKLLGYGNGAFVGDDNPAVVGVDVNAIAYHDFSVGYQRNITEKLSVGGRAKVLLGYGNVGTDAFEAKLFTDPETYALRVEENLAMRASMPSVFKLKDGKLLANGPFKVGDFFRNPGFGIDLAAEYRFDERFSAAAVVRDLGFIYWRGNNMQMTGKVDDAGQFYADGDFLFNGIDVDQLQLIVSDEDYREKFLDTLKQYFPVEYDAMDAYTTMMNTNLMLRGNYDLDAHNRFSAQVQGRFLGSGFRPAMTLAYCGSFWNNLNVCATYTMMPDSYDNIGLGISAMIQTCNIYLTTNNVFGFFKPLNTSALNAQVGIVFNLWQPEKRYIDESGRPDYLE